jgi:hypothetical protein
MARALVFLATKSYCRPKGFRRKRYCRRRLAGVLCDETAQSWRSHVRRVTFRHRRFSPETEILIERVIEE